MNEKKLDTLLKEALCPPIAEEEILVYEKEANKTMKRRNKVFAIALAACMLVGTTVLASGKITAYVSGTHLQSYSYGEMKKAEADAGFRTLDLPEEFTNGYHFEECSVMDWKSVDDQNHSVGSFNEINAWYVKGGERLALHMQKTQANGLESEDPQPMETCMVGQTEVNAYTYHYKFVPTDYVLTEEDEAFEAIPGNEISVGSDKVELVDMSAVCFQVDGVDYTFLDHEGTEHISEMMDMAGELLK